MAEAMEKDSRFLLAEKYVQETGKSVFLTGKAGTGKTTFLRHIVAETTKRCAVVAPTGVAAVNAGGVTIHSFFQLPLCPYLPDVKELVTEYQIPEKYRTLRKERIQIFRTLDLLIIDEISMVRADILDAIDATLRRYRRDDRPFGGVQLLMIGDIQQLPPVVTDAEKPYMEQVYPSPFFFNSKALRKLQYIVIELQKIHRQSDAEFMSILNDIRSASPGRATLRTLNSRLDPGFVPPENPHWIRLTTHNYQADAVNREKMDALKGKPVSFDAEIDGNYPENSYPADTSLVLKVGAQVMFTRNDTSGDRLYYNGKIGTVTALKPDIVVTDEEGNEIAVQKEKWENIKYDISSEDNEIKALVDGTFTQYPLRPAWAITIHKSQGLTFDRVVIDAGKAFSFGQVYVALSRCRTLEGIVLSSSISSRCTFSNQEVAAFEDSYTPEEMAEAGFDRCRLDFFTEKLCEAFNLKRLKYLYGKLNGIWQNELVRLFPTLSKTFGSLADTSPDTEIKGFNELSEIGVRFQTQLKRIIDADGTKNTDGVLAGRISKAAAYFDVQLSALAKIAAPMALAEIENKETRKIFKVAFENFLKELKFRILLYEDIVLSGFDVKRSAKIKTDSELEQFRTLKALVKALNSIVEGGEEKTEGKKKNASADDAGTTKAEMLESRHPEVLEALVAWRKEKYTALGVPAFMVMHQRTLIHISNILPQSKEELLQADGFGKAKWEKYGREILELLARFGNNLDIR